MVTQQDLDEAEAAVEAAEQALDTAEAYHATAGSERAVMELRCARAEAHCARDRVRQLRNRWSAEQASGQAREAAERAFPERQRKALVKRLAASRDEAVAAIVAAERAAAGLLDAVGAYSGAVREAAADLRVRGLDASGGQELGGTAGGVAHVGGEVWRPADAALLLAAVVSSVVRAGDPRHPVAAQQWGQLGGLPEKAARDELLRVVER